MNTLLKERLVSYAAGRLSPKVRLGVAVLLSFFAAGAIWRCYFAPQMDRVAHLKAEQERMRHAIARAEEERWDDIPGMKREIIRLNSRLDELRKAVPDCKDIPGMAMYLSRIAEKCGVKPALEKEGEAGIKIGKPVYTKGYTAYDLRLKVYGAPHQVYAFVSGIEEAPRMVQVQELRWETRQDNLVDCFIVVRVFVLGTPKKDPGNRPFMDFTRPDSWPYEMMKSSLLLDVNGEPFIYPEASAEKDRGALEEADVNGEIANPK